MRQRVVTTSADGATTSDNWRFGLSRPVARQSSSGVKGALSRKMTMNMKCYVNRLNNCIYYYTCMYSLYFLIVLMLLFYLVQIHKQRYISKIILLFYIIIFVCTLLLFPFTFYFIFPSFHLFTLCFVHCLD